jgi:hypothetical protein
VQENKYILTFYYELQQLLPPEVLGVPEPEVVDKRTAPGWLVVFDEPLPGWLVLLSTRP